MSIGRHESNDLQLASRTVSNFHAEIVSENGRLLVRDLGSIHGTYVNDRQIEVEHIDTGDRIRVGNHVMTLQLTPQDPEDASLGYQKSPPVLGEGTRGRIISLHGRSTDAKKTLRGKDPNDLTFPDLLKSLSANPQYVRAVVKRGEDHAHVIIQRQSVVHAEYGPVVGVKALYRLFGWQAGTYQIEAIDPTEVVPRTIELPVEKLVIEGMSHAVEIGQLIATLPPLEATLRLEEDCPLPMTAHSPDEIEMFQLIIRHETISAVLEKSTLADVRVLRLIDSLLRKGVFDDARTSDASFEETLLPAPPRSAS